MKIIWNLLALLGLAVVVLLVAAYLRLPAGIGSLSRFDDQAVSTYLDMGRTLLQTGDGAAATVWKVAVNAGLSAEDVEQTMKLVANEHNLQNVGELPLYRQIEAISGKPARFIKIYMFCNALTAEKMIAYSPAYAAYLPCRITLLEDASGKLWLNTLNMDLMIHGGRELPPALKQEAIQVRTMILDIMQRGARGDF
jgi:hypothetical protein